MFFDEDDRDQFFPYCRRFVCLESLVVAMDDQGLYWLFCESCQRKSYHQKNLIPQSVASGLSLVSMGKISKPSNYRCAVCGETRGKHSEHDKPEKNKRYSISSTTKRPGIFIDGDKDTPTDPNTTNTVKAEMDDQNDTVVDLELESSIEQHNSVEQNEQRNDSAIESTSRLETAEPEIDFFAGLNENPKLINRPQPYARGGYQLASGNREAGYNIGAFVFAGVLMVASVMIGLEWAGVTKIVPAVAEKTKRTGQPKKPVVAKSKKTTRQTSETVFREPLQANENRKDENYSQFSKEDLEEVPLISIDSNDLIMPDESKKPAAENPNSEKRSLPESTDPFGPVSADAWPEDDGLPQTIDGNSSPERESDVESKKASAAKRITQKQIQNNDLKQSSETVIEKQAANPDVVQSKKTITEPNQIQPSVVSTEQNSEFLKSAPSNSEQLATTNQATAKPANADPLESKSTGEPKSNVVKSQDDKSQIKPQKPLAIKASKTSESDEEQSNAEKLEVENDRIIVEDKPKNKSLPKKVVRNSTLVLNAGKYNLANIAGNSTVVADNLEITKKLIVEYKSLLTKEKFNDLVYGEQNAWQNTFKGIEKQTKMRWSKEFREPLQNRMRAVGLQNAGDLKTAFSEIIVGLETVIKNLPADQK